MTRKISFLLFALVIFAQNYLQGQNNATKHYNLDQNKIALEGYDVVSYFTENKPLKGNKNYSYTYNGATYYFKNDANKQAFIKNPAKYEPAYGGWCALAIAKNGDKVAVDPLSYKISKGRLLLFYKTAFYSALNHWNKDKTPEEELLNKGDEYWKNIIKK